MVIPRLVALLSRDTSRHFLHARPHDPQHAGGVTPLRRGWPRARPSWLDHRLPVSLSREEEEEEIVRGNELIKKNQRPRRRAATARPPGTSRLTRLSSCWKHGIKYDSSLMGHD